MKNIQLVIRLKWPLLLLLMPFITSLVFIIIFISFVVLTHTQRMRIKVS